VLSWQVSLWSPRGEFAGSPRAVHFPSLVVERVARAATSGAQERGGALTEEMEGPERPLTVGVESVEVLSLVLSAERLVAHIPRVCTEWVHPARA
jgi:hypothetical protein